MIGLWKSGWGIALLVSPFIIGLTGVAIDLQIAGSRHFRVMITALRRSSSLHMYLCLWGTNSLLSRAMVVSAMSGLLCFPDYSVKKRGLDAEDSRDFPTYLRRRMRLASWLTAIGALWLLMAVALLELTKG